MTDTQKANFFNHANQLRRQYEFDKAIAAYEDILSMEPASAKAHWGLVLSKYGIEYVEDLAKEKRVTYCHRLQSASFLADRDYLAALENAEDDLTKSLYKEEAERINEIQKDLLAIAMKEKPYNMYICYKELTETGKGTKDSKLAIDLMYKLAQKGHYSFASPKEMLDYNSMQYEPHIFNALNSAKLMIVVGTKPENFKDIWVKNEWSRFLASMKNDSAKLLIPCYQNMSAHDLPEEMAMLQSYDMGRTDFFQDILHTVEKVLGIIESVESHASMGRVYLKSAKWDLANEQFEKALAIEPEYAPAYIGKLCSALQISQESKIAEHSVVENKDYIKAQSFADTYYRAKLEWYFRDYEEKLLKADEYERELQSIPEEKRREQKILELEKLHEAVCEYVNKIKEHEIKIIPEPKSVKWQKQGLCTNCGGKIGLFGSCKICKRKSSKSDELPDQQIQLRSDVKYEVPDIKVVISGISWRILDISEDKVLLLSDKIIEKKAYHDSDTDIEWENCTLRKYLNGEFYNKLGVVRSAVADTRITNSKNLWYSNNDDNTTTDKVFLLSLDEIDRYFGNSGDYANWCRKEYDSEDREFIRTSHGHILKNEYDADRLARDYEGSSCFWWLRSHGRVSDYAAYVYDCGGVCVEGCTVYDSSVGVRPALWINLK